MATGEPRPRLSASGASHRAWLTGATNPSRVSSTSRHKATLLYADLGTVLHPSITPPKPVFDLFNRQASHLVTLPILVFRLLIPAQPDHPEQRPSFLCPRHASPLSFFVQPFGLFASTTNPLRKTKHGSPAAPPSSDSFVSPVSKRLCRTETRLVLALDFFLLLIGSRTLPCLLLPVSVCPSSVDPVQSQPNFLMLPSHSSIRAIVTCNDTFCASEWVDVCVCVRASSTSPIPSSDRHTTRSCPSKSIVAALSRLPDALKSSAFAPDPGNPRVCLDTTGAGQGGTSIRPIDFCCPISTPLPSSSLPPHHGRMVLDSGSGRGFRFIHDTYNAHVAPTGHPLVAHHSIKAVKKHSITQN